MKTKDWLRQWHYAHRGLHGQGSGAVENSLGAFQKAMRAGYGIECDVWPLRGGDFAVFHDADLQRLTRRQGCIWEQSVESLRAVRLAGSLESIPLLSELLQVVDGRVPLLIELKEKAACTDCFGRYQHLVALLADYPGPVAVMGFNAQLLGSLQAQLKPLGVCLGWLSAEVPSDGQLPSDESTYAFRADFLGLEAQALIQASNSGSTKQKLFASKPVLSWTVRSRAQALQLRSVADALIFEGWLPSSSDEGLACGGSGVCA
jgi:glycerophosphoryl diester phosphodiesterase